MIEGIPWTIFVGSPALFGLMFGFLAMAIFRRPTFGIAAGILGALAGVGIAAIL